MYKIGVFFHKIARFFYSHSLGVCWTCGTNCGMNSTMARGFLWCNNCYEKYKYVISDRNFLFSYRYFGYPDIDGAKKRSDKIGGV